MASRNPPIEPVAVTTAPRLMLVTPAMLGVSKLSGSVSAAALSESSAPGGLVECAASAELATRWQ